MKKPQKSDFSSDAMKSKQIEFFPFHSLMIRILRLSPSCVKTSRSDFFNCLRNNPSSIVIVVSGRFITDISYTVKKKQSCTIRQTVYDCGKKLSTVNSFLVVRHWMHWKLPSMFPWALKYLVLIKYVMLWQRCFRVQHVFNVYRSFSLRLLAID